MTSSVIISIYSSTFINPFSSIVRKVLVPKIIPTINTPAMQRDFTILLTSTVTFTLRSACGEQQSFVMATTCSFFYYGLDMGREKQSVNNLTPHQLV